MDEIKSELMLVAERLRTEMPELELVVGISRAGFIPATMLAQIMHLPMGAYWPKTPDNDGFIVTPTHGHDRHVLFVDEIVAKGRTLEEVCTVARQQVGQRQFPSSLADDWRYLSLYVDKDAPMSDVDRLGKKKLTDLDGHGS